MPAISKKTRAQVRRIVEMFGAGKSITEISRVEGLARTTVRQWLDNEGAKPPAVKPPTQEQKNTKRRREKSAEIIAKTIALEHPTAEHLGIVAVRLRLQQIRALIESALIDVASDATSASAMAALGKLEQQYASTLTDLEVRARPPEKPDPEKDPTNAETVARLASKLETLIMREEKNRKCVHCNQHPDR